ncbi:unnamed protein product [Acanthoscelides obtectus]|uniref:Carboxylic ester hydrolase n=1 Tax=Acanthoscelides obtectus TaxID=200917 RepID=A0A9P0K1S7_ACAOB|nr:unnamed protein product [Acanthoscelides obtectus]CAK1663373.1 hypothetical protein AOBTE_LOCUS23639 [Acanthoscelides obtectus]
MLLSTNSILLFLPVFTYTFHFFHHCNDLTIALRNPANSKIRGDCRSSHKGRPYRSFTNIPYAEPPIGKRRLQAKKEPHKKLPVLFWIHGGGFQFGSGTHMFLGIGFLELYDPGLFIDENIVVVTINYRLGALGFLTTEDEVIPPNLGLRDQNLALKWVIDNIDLFGGDPGNIVLMGESAGSASVGYHLLSKERGTR